MNLAIIDATSTASPESDHRRGGRYATPIANLPLIAHVADELASSGIARAIVVAQHDVRRELGRILGGGHLWGLEVSYVDADESDARYAVLGQVERALASEPVLLHPGDCLFGPQVTAMHDRFGLGDVDVVLPEQLSVSALRSIGRRQATEAVIALGPSAQGIVAALRSPAGEGDDLITALLASDCRLAVCAASDPWYYSNDPEDLLAGNRVLLDRLRGDDLPGEIHTRNQLQGPISLHSTVYASDCVIAGPAIVGERAVLEGSFIGPYTAIGAGAVLRGADIDNSMVLAGAEIHHPGLRITSSIIGEHARVTRSFQLPRGIHLRLGPDAQVDFS